MLLKESARRERQRMESLRPRIFDNQALDAAGYPSRWTRRLLMKEGKFPQPDFRVGLRPYWKSETLDVWEEEMMER